MAEELKDGAVTGEEADVGSVDTGTKEDETGIDNDDAGKSANVTMTQEEFDTIVADAKTSGETIKGLKSEIQTATDRVAFSQHQMAMLQNGQFPNQQVQGVDHTPNEQEVYIDDDSVVTGSEVKKIVAASNSGLKKDVANMSAQLKNVLAAVKDPDATKVLSEKLPKLLKERPKLLEVINNSASPMATAIELVKMAGLKDEPKIDTEADAKSVLDKIIENSKKAGSLSGVNGKADKSASANMFNNMSDADFTAYQLAVEEGRIKVGQTLP